jgi:hypothetical protein
LKALVAIAFAFVVLSAGDCDFSSLGDILDEPGQIVVSNTGTEVAIVAISAEDVKSYPTIAGGGTGSAQTNVGGAYTVSVTMTQQQTLEYRDDLLNLRRTVERLVDGSATSEEKVYAFTKLAGIKAALAQLNSGSGASCSGNIKLKPDDAVTVNATVEWVTQSGTGFWNLNCGSSD